MERKYHQDVAKIREDYRNKVSEEAVRAEQIKKSSMAHKQKIETKLISLEEENEVILTSMQQ